jgi:hypothetical protein
MGRGDDVLTDSRPALTTLLGRLAEPSWLTITNVTVTI